MSEMISIQNINPINKGNVLASCTVEIRPWKLKIHKVLVFQKGTQRWVTFPSEKFENTAGEIKYNELLEFTDNGARVRFRDQIMEAVDAYMALHGDEMIPEDVIKIDEPFPF